MQDREIAKFFPEYSPKGKKLYHRRSTMTPEQQLVSDFFERFREEGIISSPTNDFIMGLQKGFIISFHEEDGKWKGLAYSKQGGREIHFVTPATPSRIDADRFLHKLIDTYYAQ